jgi:hypothetical protein
MGRDNILHSTYIKIILHKLVLHQMIGSEMDGGVGMRGLSVYAQQEVHLCIVRSR